MLEYSFGKAAKSWLLLLVVLAIAAAIAGGVILHSYEGEDDAVTDAQSQSLQSEQEEQDEHSGNHEHQDENKDTHQNEDASDHEHQDENDGEYDHRDERGNQNAGDSGHEHQDEHDDDRHFAAMTTTSKIALVCIGAVLGTVGIVVRLFLAAWLYQAAELAGMNGMLWALLGLVGFVITALVFLIVRSFRHRCPVCGRRQEKAEFCRFCGAPMQQKCIACGLSIPDHSAFCPHCGKAQKEQSSC